MMAAENIMMARDLYRLPRNSEMVMEPVASVIRLMRLPRMIHARAQPTSTLLAPIHSVASPYL